MTLRHADGFDHYGTNASLLNELYTTLSLTLMAATAGMTGPNMLRVGSNGYLLHTLGYPNKSKYIIGGRFKIPAITNAVWFKLGTGAYSNETANSGYCLWFNSDGSVEIRNGFFAAAKIGQSAPGSYTANSAFYCELRVTLGSAGAGSLEVRINNTTVLVITGLSTPTTMDLASVGSRSGPVTFDFDDYYFIDGDGSKNNNFLGDRQMVTTFANADAPGNTWTLTGDVTGYGILDNNPPDDTKYISGVNVGDISEFNHQSIATTAVDIAGAVLFARCSKSDAGVATMGVGLESNGITNYDTAIAPSVGFGLYKRILELDPDGNINWTYAKFNAAKLRAERLT